MPFDLGTLYLSSALSRAAYFLVFVIVAARQPREFFLWHWIVAIVASMIGSLVSMSVPITRWFTPVEAITVYTFYAASLTLSWSGLRLFNGRSAPLSQILVATASPGVWYVLAQAGGVPMRFALAGVVGLCALFAAVGAFEAVRRKREARLWSAYVVSGTLGLYAATLSLTFVVLVATDRPMNSSESGMISMIVDQASGILIYFGYIAMAKEQAVLTIEHLAETDPLTGLVNRRGLQVALGRLRDSPRPKPPGGLLLADLDHFKAVNDTHGHAAGDAILVEFAQRLRAALRQKDIVARWGGEEFLAILPQTEARALAAIAERLRASVEAEPFALPDGGTIRLTVSIGISELPTGPVEFEPATRRADAALYTAKAAGRNRIGGLPSFDDDEIREGRAA